jgi:hypothetical protein
MPYRHDVAPGEALALGEGVGVGEAVGAGVGVVTGGVVGDEPPQPETRPIASTSAAETGLTDVVLPLISPRQNA